jgi:integrase
VKHIKHLLSGVYKFAMQQGLFERANPVTATSIPDAPVANETYAYSLEEITRMAAILPAPAATVVLTAAFSGLRRGEIRGMRWENLERGEPLAFYRVSQSIWNGIVTEPKTTKSRAPVPLIGILAAKLEAHRAACGNPRSGPIFTNALGKPLDLDGLYPRFMKDILHAACIERHGGHAFRRGLATNFASARRR